MATMNCVDEKDDIVQGDALLPEDVERFRMATLRAKLASYGVYAERDADEGVLCRLLHVAEQRAERRLAQEKKCAQHVNPQTGYACKSILDKEYTYE